MGIEQIPIHVDNGSDGLSGNASAILREVADMLDRLARTGETGAIDLAALPLTPADKAWLSERLGKGEVEISMELNGASRIHETAYPGIWWITHLNPMGAEIGEFIEVTPIPDMVPSQSDDIVRGSESLNFLINDLC